VNLPVAVPGSNSRSLGAINQFEPPVMSTPKRAGLRGAAVVGRLIPGPRAHRGLKSGTTAQVRAPSASRNEKGDARGPS